MKGSCRPACEQADREEGTMEAQEVQIGEAAGKIWKTLHANGPMLKAQLAKQTGLPSDLLHLGIGWLAREGKIVFDKGKTGAVGLRK